MSIKKVTLSLAILVATICLIQPSRAEAQYIESAASKEVKKGLASSWSCSRPCTGCYTEITFAIGDDGKIYEPNIIRFSQDDQYVAECLEAVCGLTPIHPKPFSFTLHCEHPIKKFRWPSGGRGWDDDNDCPTPAYDGSDVKEYLTTHPQPTDPDEAFIVIHKIPLSVLTRYPGFFTKEELLNPKNLLEIKAGLRKNNRTEQDGHRFVQPSYAEAIGNLYASWGELFKDPNVTRQNILDGVIKAQIRAGIR
jgi:hypothetical protein